MPSPETLAAIARRHRVDPGMVTPVPSQGIANRVYFLGDHLVLRIARPETGEDLRKEAVVIPAAVRAGVRTPELVDFDDSGALIAAPFMVLRRVIGVVPGIPEGPADERWSAAYRRLGVELAALHAGVDALPGVPVDESGDPRSDLARLAAAGHLSTEVTAWLSSWFDRLDPLRPSAAPARLIHGDASPTNLLVDPETLELKAILDWGDTAWADPAVEFAKLPLRAVPTVLAGYLGECDEAWAARILWHHLHWAVGRIATPAEPHAAHWSAQPANRLMEVMRFLLADPPSPWAALRPGA